ncbi:MAG: DEAD/DEAH box helicase, partial [Dehalococcoidia bacterium]
MTQFGLFEEPPKELGWWEDLPPAPRAGTDGLRWYQTEAHAATFAAWNGGARSVLNVLATGLGKTQIFSGIAADFKGNVLVLAHRDELINQGAKRLEQITGEMVEIEQAELRASKTGRIVMGSVPTMRRLDRLERMGPDRFDLIIIDESHHATAKSYRTILDYFSKAKVLGVTATPDRTDGKAMGQVFDEVAYSMDILAGIDSGYLVPFDGEMAVMEELKLGDVDTTAGDFVAKQLDNEVVKIVEAVVADVREHHPKRTGIFFFPGVKSAEYAAEKFNVVDPGSAIVITGKTDRQLRKQMVQEFREGRRKYLCNCMVATEGFDAP